MSKRITVFYSWQSDTPSNLNRNFIEKALREALNRLHSDAAVEPALRDVVVELDKDTQGVAGSPPIAETILRKISECAVFVADLTFVGVKSPQLAQPGKPTRSFPNPNVLLEYGFALKCHGHAALISIMNSAFGEPNEASLPFDLRHLRWPITYHLADPAAPTKDTQFQKLVSTLADALRLVLAQRPKDIASQVFAPQQATKNPAVFFNAPADLVPEGPFGHQVQVSEVPCEGQLYIRLQPTTAVPVIETELDASRLATKGCLRPMGEVSGYSVARNQYGAIIYEAPKNGRLYHLTQLLLNREIWGLDAYSINGPVCREYSKCKSNGFVIADEAEEIFTGMLQNYLAFAETHLDLPLPLHIEAGLIGIKGYQLGVNDRLAGKALQESVLWQGDVATFQLPAATILEPFFNKIWSTFGIPRPPSRQQELVQRFAKEGA